MIVTFDLGNSDLVVGSFKDNRLITTFRTRSDRYKSVDEFAYTLKELFFSKGLDSMATRGAVLASVVPELTKVVVAAIKRVCGVEPLVLAPGVKTGLRIKADNPAEVGADLIGDCVGAILRYPLPAIVIDLGTASKIIAIDEQGTFIGCAIAPGLKLSAEALTRTASQLPTISLVMPKKAICNNTPDCMNSGFVYGAAAMVDGMIQRFELEMGKKCTRIMTGGLTSVVSPACREPIIVDRELLLYGLYEIYNRNIKEKKENEKQ
jgi:type III pantothenate kinase